MDKPDFVFTSKNQKYPTWANIVFVGEVKADINDGTIEGQIKMRFKSLVENQIPRSTFIALGLTFTSFTIYYFSYEIENINKSIKHSLKKKTYTLM